MSLLDVKGQSRAVTMIKKFITDDAINGSFLFSGRTGIGKHLAAVNMAKAMNCTGETRESWLSDDACPACRKIEKGIHPDVMQLTVPIPDDASQMETVVKSIEWLGVPLFEGRQKVLIVDDASELNVHAQNAMLKTLEEPPPWATILLVTASPARLLPTVQSRLIKVGFNRLSAEVIREILAARTKLDDEQLQYVSLVSNGGIKYFSLNEMEDDVKKILTLFVGLEGPVSVVRLAEHFRLSAYKEHFEELVDIILSFLIDAVVAADNPSLIRNKGFQKEIAAFSGQFRRRAIINAAYALEKAREAYNLNISPQMIMEHVLFQLTGDIDGD